MFSELPREKKAREKVNEKVKKDTGKKQKSLGASLRSVPLQKHPSQYLSL